MPQFLPCTIGRLFLQSLTWPLPTPQVTYSLTVPRSSSTSCDPCTSTTPFLKPSLSCFSPVSVALSLGSSPSWLSSRRKHLMTLYAFIMSIAGNGCWCNIFQRVLHLCRTLNSDSIKDENLFFIRGIHWGKHCIWKEKYFDVLDWEARWYTPPLPTSIVKPPTKDLL